MSIQDDYFYVRHALSKSKKPAFRAFENIWRVFCQMEEKLEDAEKLHNDVQAMRRVLGLEDKP